MFLIRGDPDPTWAFRPSLTLWFFLSGLVPPPTDKTLCLNHYLGLPSFSFLRLFLYFRGNISGVFVYLDPSDLESFVKCMVTTPREPLTQKLFTKEVGFSGQTLVKGHVV